MGEKTGLVLKSLQCFIRCVQCSCATAVLAVFSYFLGILYTYRFPILGSVRAVEGISGAAVLYTSILMMVLYCVRGLSFMFRIARILDTCFFFAFTYVAAMNKNGAGNCSGYLDTPFWQPSGNETYFVTAFASLPSPRTICRLQTTCFAASIIATMFFIFSLFMDTVQVRYSRKQNQKKSPGPEAGTVDSPGFDLCSSRFFELFSRNKKANQNGPGQLSGQSHGSGPTMMKNDGRGLDGSHPGSKPGPGHETGVTRMPPPVQGRWLTPGQTNTLASLRYSDGLYERD